MIQTDVTFFLAFLAGTLSFLSPCVLPVLPSFLGYISGISVDSKALQLPTKKLRRALAVSGVFFSLGFLVVFLVVGASVGFFAQFFVQHQRELQIAGGIFILLLGFWMWGFFKLPFLNREVRFRPPRWLASIHGPFHSFLVGIFFSFGWAPCYGPVTGAILTLIAVKGSMAIGAWLFFAYSLGFILPFLIFSFFVGHALSWLRTSKKWLRYFNLFSGALVVALGLLLLTNQFSVLVGWLLSYYDEWDFWNLN